MILELAYTSSATRKHWKSYDQNMDLLYPGYTAAGGSNPTNDGVQ